MTPEEKAQELFNKMKGFRVKHTHSKKCALICVEQIILANPHSNPFNTDVYPTMDYWLEVKEEIKKL
jgi:hypothetical protein